MLVSVIIAYVNIVIYNIIQQLTTSSFTCGKMEVFRVAPSWRRLSEEEASASPVHSTSPSNSGTTEVKSQSVQTQ